MRKIKLAKIVAQVGMILTIIVGGSIFICQPRGSVAPAVAPSSSPTSGLELFQEVPCRYMREIIEIYEKQGWKIVEDWVQAAYLFNDKDVLDSQCGLTVRPPSV